MQVSSWVFYGLIEAVLFLGAACTLMGLYLWRVKHRGWQLRGNLRRLMQDHRQLHQQLLTERDNHSLVSNYREQIETQLKLTRQYHHSQGSNRSIHLDMAPDTPLPRLTSAVRHAVLVAEKEALHNSEDGTPDWELLGERIQRLVNFYQTANPPQPTKAKPHSDNKQQTTEATETIDPATGQQQLSRLRELNEGQSQLRENLEAYLNADQEQQADRLKQLQEELKLQKRWADEVDACVKVLENELVQAGKRINELENNLDESQRELTQIGRLQTTIRELKVERREQRQQIEELQQIANQFMAEPGCSTASDKLDENADNNPNENPENAALQLAQQQLRQLQADYDALLEQTSQDAENR